MSCISSLTRAHEGPHIAGDPSTVGLVGNTPVVWIGEPFTPSGRGFWAKLEGANPGGLKDRPALHIVDRARNRAELEPGAMIVESTSGTFGLGLAMAGIVYGHPVTLVADPGMEPLIRDLLAAYGARTEIVTAPHPEGGWQRARLDRVSEILKANPGAYSPQQYDNPDNSDAYRALARELVGQLARIDVLVCSVGTGGHSGGIIRVLRGLFPEIRLVGVDATGSAIFGQPAGPRLMRGLGSSIYPRNVAYEEFDEVHWVAPAEAVWASRTLAATHYTTGGWSVGAVTVVAAWLARTLPAHRRIVAVFPDGPARYHGTVFNDDYCARHGLLDRPPAAEPDEITDPLRQEALRWSRCTTVLDPTAEL
ncbi:PLP-dependent cysteine synthase family protein [Actinomadura alba]|uniref:PLP-dependent cysteine synthase family protein n=1 Tax=Actinomadura alba TaxID=406431 RepID=A0ABR7M3F6_9ACTN|nr:PLP-dependent cysteine synthase family protein [Actinomadura alba]